MSWLAAYKIGSAPCSASLTMNRIARFTSPGTPPTWATRLVAAMPGWATIERTGLAEAASRRFSSRANTVTSSLESQ